MSKNEPLGVWLEGTHIADLTTKGGSIRCRYTDEARSLAPTGSPLISCSLPLSTGRPNATAFCVGLLPEGQHRLAMAALAKIPANDTFGLLRRFGKDVAGALVISPDPPELRPGSVEPYTGDTLAAEVAGLPNRSLALYDDSELSLPGLQDKLLLVRLPDGGWGRPVHGSPSTHILKLDDLQRPGLVAAEADCLRLADHVGISASHPELVELGGRRCLVVERFDRRTEPDGTVVRVHQEDACQALGRSPEANRGRGKYQAAGGPSLSEIAGILDKWAPDVRVEQARLLRSTVFNVMVGNADAHGKNLALFHPDPGSVVLAPLYDTVPTALWPKLRPEMAMSVGGKWVNIRPDDLINEARSWGMGGFEARRVVEEVTERLASAPSELDLSIDVAELVSSRSKAMLDALRAPGVPTKTTVGGQGRRPAGSPSGGQFSSRSTPESTARLDLPGDG